MKGKVNSMENRIYDEKNGLWYERQGDYYIPCLTLPEEEEKSIGVWGNRHLRHLKEHRNGFYSELLLDGKLNGYLAEIDEQAKESFSRIVKELAQKEGVTEKLKAENQMEWVRRMNNIRDRAKEIVNAEIIFAEQTSCERKKTDERVPKVFWKYYDLFRRNQINIAEYSSMTGLTENQIRHLFSII